MNQLVRDDVVSAEARAPVDERERIAGDLHDVVIQSLVGIGLRLVRLATDVQEPELRNDLYRVAGDLDRTTAEARNYIVAAPPRTNPKPTLVETAHPVPREAEQSFGLRVRFEFDRPFATLHSGGASELLEMILEALSSAVHHERVSQCCLVLGIRDGNIELSIRDNGDGCNATWTTSGEINANMHERAVSLGTARHLGQSARSSGDERLSRLTKQEQRVLEFVADGKTNLQIAELLHLSERTVKNYVSEILEKLKVARRAQAAAYLAERRGRPPRG